MRAFRVFYSHASRLSHAITKEINKMKLYTDGICVFKTDDYIKNLKSIEVNNLTDFDKAGLDVFSLLDTGKAYCVSRFDEIVLQEIRINSFADEPEILNCVFDFDFLKDLSKIDILQYLSTIEDAESLDCALDDMSKNNEATISYEDDDETIIYTIEEGDKTAIIKIKNNNTCTMTVL
jgi:hypothetical protein